MMSLIRQWLHSHASTLREDQHVPPLETCWMQVRGMSLHTTRSLPMAPRNAVPIVLLHALGTSSQTMLPLFRALAKEYPVYTLDLPGHGKSRRAPFIASLAALAEIVNAWMDTLGLAETVVVGHSTGCQIALHLGHLAPEKLCQAVFISPALDERTRSAVRQGVRLLWSTRYEAPTLPFVLGRAYLAVGPYHVWQTIRSDLRSEFLPLLPHFAYPTLVVSGAKDAVVPPVWGARVARALPQGRFIFLPGVGHAPQYSTPKRLAAAMIAFLLAAPSHQPASKT